MSHLVQPGICNVCMYVCMTGQLVTSQLVCDVTINRPRITSAIANLGFHSQGSLAMLFASDDMPLNEWQYENMYKWCHESRRNYTFANLKAAKMSKRCVFVLVTWPWRLPEEWSETCGSLTVVSAGTMHILALTQLEIQQSDWWRAGIRSINLHIVVECGSGSAINPLFLNHTKAAIAIPSLSAATIVESLWSYGIRLQCVM